MFVTAVLCCVLLGFVVRVAAFHLKRFRLSGHAWGDLLSKIEPVNVPGIAAIAEGYLSPTGAQLKIEPDVMWLIIGGFKGLDVLNRNADAMLDLAMYVSQWNRVEGRIVTELIRRDGVRLKRAIRKMQRAMLSQVAVKYASFELFEAAATYHMMRKRLLGLYEVANIGLHTRLAVRV